MGLAMSYLRLPSSLDGETDPGRIAQRLFGTPGWRDRCPAPQRLDVGGAWQALHYMVTGDPWDGRPPEADVVCGGRLLTEDGAERYGMDVIYLAPERVKPVADHLSSTPFVMIAGRCDLERMAAAGVQGASEMVGRPVADVRDRLLRPGYERLERFFTAAATEGQAVYKLMY